MDAHGPKAPEPHRLGSQIYDDAAAGRAPEGGYVIRHGRGWWRRGPYATLLLTVAVLDGFVRVPGGAWRQISPLLPIGLALCLAAVPLVWIWITRREILPRKGLALVLTPAEALMRTRAGVLRVTWARLARVYVEANPTWSICRGLPPQEAAGHRACGGAANPLRRCISRSPGGGRPGPVRGLPARCGPRPGGVRRYRDGSRSAGGPVRCVGDEGERLDAGGAAGGYGNCAFTNMRSTGHGDFLACLAAARSRARRRSRPPRPGRPGG